MKIPDNLPWRISEVSLDVLRDNKGEYVLSTSIENKDYLKYAVEACNNYQRVIELLQYFVQKVDDGKAKSFETYNLYKDFLNSINK